MTLLITCFLLLLLYTGIQCPECPPSGWDCGGTACFYIYTCHNSFSGATEACTQQGLTLASVASNQERQFLWDVINSVGPSDNLFWLGGVRESISDEFSWLDGSPFPFTAETNKLSDLCLRYRGITFNDFESNQCNQWHQYVCRNGTGNMPPMNTTTTATTTPMTSMMTPDSTSTTPITSVATAITSTTTMASISTTATTTTAETASMTTATTTGSPTATTTAATTTTTAETASMTTATTTGSPTATTTAATTTTTAGTASMTTATTTGSPTETTTAATTTTTAETASMTTATTTGSPTATTTAATANSTVTTETSPTTATQQITTLTQRTTPTLTTSRAQPTTQPTTTVAQLTSGTQSTTTVTQPTSVEQTTTVTTRNTTMEDPASSTAETTSANTMKSISNVTTVETASSTLGYPPQDVSRESTSTVFGNLSTPGTTASSSGAPGVIWGTSVSETPTSDVSNGSVQSSNQLPGNQGTEPTIAPTSTSAPNASAYQSTVVSSCECCAAWREFLNRNFTSGTFRLDDLLVYKKKKLQTVDDPRISARGIGGSAVALLVISFLTIVVLDAGKLFHDFSQMYKHLREAFRLQNVIDTQTSRVGDA